MAAQCIGYKVERFSSCPKKAAVETFSTHFRMWFSEHHFDKTSCWEFLNLWNRFGVLTGRHLIFQRVFFRIMTFFSHVCSSHFPSYDVREWTDPPFQMLHPPSLSVRRSVIFGAPIDQTQKNCVGTWKGKSSSCTRERGLSGETVPARAAVCKYLDFSPLASTCL